MKIIKNLCIYVSAILAFIVCYYAFHISKDSFDGMTLWKKVDFSILILHKHIKFYDVVHFVIGFLLFTHGIIRVTGITEQNHSVRNKDTRKPTSLLTTGYYEKVRHPMYGAFMLCQLGFLFSWRSMLGIALIFIIVVIQYFNGVFEEGRELTVIFGQEYINYKEKVKARYFTRIMKIEFLIAIIIMALGIVFM